VKEQKMALATVDRIRVKRGRGRPKQRPRVLAADKGYDDRKLRRQLRRRGIIPSIPERERKRPGRPIEVGPHYAERWKVERLFSWLGNFRRLLVRQDRYPSIFRALVLVAFIVICLRQF